MLSLLIKGPAHVRARNVSETFPSFQDDKQKFGASPLCPCLVFRHHSTSRISPDSLAVSGDFGDFDVDCAANTDVSDTLLDGDTGKSQVVSVPTSH